MTENQIIDALLDREKGFLDDPKVGATMWGITPKPWGAYKRLGRPATADEIRAITRPEAVEFYRHELRTSVFGAITDEALRVQLFDYGENSGSELALRWLQRVLQVPRTGKLDVATTVAMLRPSPTLIATLINNALAAARGVMIIRSVDAPPTDKGHIDKKFERGLIRRALSFAELQVP